MPKTVLKPAPNPTPTPEAARAAFRAFVRGVGKSMKVVVLHDSDADGVAAGVVLEAALERAGFGDVARLAPDRERNPWSEANRARVAKLKPERLFLLDLGSREERVVEGVETCYVDHHRPEGLPRGDTLVTAYGWETIPNTSLLVFELCAGIADVSDLDWVAAVGTLSDLGERAPFPLIAEAKKKYTAKYLKEATALVNAARRASRYEPERAARALAAHADPRSLVNSESEDVAALRAARAEVKAELERAKQSAPVFAGRAALVRVNSPCQIHPLLAQIWRTRLPAYFVLAANEGYLPGRVNFSARSTGGASVLEFLRSFELTEGEGSYGMGHDQASGGSLPVERWNELLGRMGFSEEVFANKPAKA